MAAETEKQQAREYDYIIVGSGAGGAPLASRLARAGKRVLVIEAGKNHTNGGMYDAGNEVSRVPGLHAVSTEHPDLAWRFFVDHYERQGDDKQLPPGIPEDPKWHRKGPAEDNSQEGIFYPRASGVGGCTIHNAMITIAGSDADWDELANFLGDPRWGSGPMRSYFRRLENNDYLRLPKRTRYTPGRALLAYVRSALEYLFFRKPDLSGGRHGFNGWLHVSFPDLKLGLRDKQLLKMIAAALRESRRAGLDSAWALKRTFFRGRFRQALDPNHVETQGSSPEGISLIPIAVYGGDTTIHQDRSMPYVMRGRRSSPREFLMETMALCPDKLDIWTDCLVTELLFADDEDDKSDPKRVVGVAYERGANLYKAHVEPNDAQGESGEVRVAEHGEVILCGGAFNTPQLLMLSGIGDPEILADPEVNITPKVILRGVGKNLQDRYEVSLVSQMKRDFTLLEYATFRLPTDPAHPDAHLRQWREEGEGLYASNGGVLAIMKRSKPELESPDLFIFGIPAEFRGYEVGYSEVNDFNRFTWVILKSHTENREGEVRLRSDDPRDTPRINFNYFHSQSRRDGTAQDSDVKAIVHGVKFVRNILEKASSVVQSEVHPGPHVSDDSAINEWIRRDAWGHHACGTCRMGPEGDDNAVLDSRFRVRHVRGLRVVDASIFPKIPGYFIVANIYMASEKAADVILEDARSVPGETPMPARPEYPAGLRDLEAKAIQGRREMAFADSPEKKSSQGTAERDLTTEEKNSYEPGPVLDECREWGDDVTGLALSGGGIRSATFCLGILQGLARKGLLRRVDVLSTVSGGGYIGSFLGRYYDRLRSIPQDLRTSSPAKHVEDGLNRDHSPIIQWLRAHGNYIAPRGKGDAWTNIATYVRNLLSVHLVVGLALFSLWGLADLLRYALADRALAVAGLVTYQAELPVARLVESYLGPWFSPWFMLFELAVLFMVVPLIVGYWLVSPTKHETFRPALLFVLLGVAGGLLWLGVHNELMLEPFFAGLALLSTLLYVESAWKRGRTIDAAMGTGGVETQRARTRNYLTYDLGLAMAIAFFVLAFAVIDALAHGLQEWASQNDTYRGAFASLGAIIIALLPLARYLANWLRTEERGVTSSLRTILKHNVMIGLLAVFLFTAPLLLYAFASHAAYAGGTALTRGLIVTVVACVFTIVFAFPSALTFVNRSSLAQAYAARLARAYLGASNPARQRSHGIDVTEVLPGDDVASIRDYRPHEAAGPLHLINLTVNETLDFGSRLRKRDRQGTSMSVSSLGITLGERWHCLWTEASGAARLPGQKVPAGLQPIGLPSGQAHPLVDTLDRAADRAEMLSLRQWVAISGAAVDPGQGASTSLGTALLMGLVNLRTGYWWDSGISEAERSGFPWPMSFLRRVLYLVPRFFTTQSLLINEWLARFPGPWQRFWHLADGGFFENLGAYELIRRRVPQIIICDSGADPEYEFSDLAELTRKARIDFGARIEPFTAEEIGNVANRENLGVLADLAPKDANGAITTSNKHATLFWVHYPQDLCVRSSVMLYIKASLTGDEPDDVTQYHRAHREFPHEPTSDQFFDEAQWESYRELGEHIAGKIFNADDWFWSLKRPPENPCQEPPSREGESPPGNKARTKGAAKRKNGGSDKRKNGGPS